MDSRVKTLTKQLREHDDCLYAKRRNDGVILVCRRSRNIYSGTITDHLIITLTEDFTPTGKPVEWGVEPILARLKEMDGFNRDITEEWIKNKEKSDDLDASRRNSRDEDFLKEFRPQFAKAFSDINTSTIEKIDNRRRLDNGNR